jgi:hypothetical protein
MHGLATILCILGSIGAICFVIMVMGNLGGGCLSSLLGLLIAIGYLGGTIAVGTEFGAPAVAIASIVGIILGIIAIKHILTSWGSGSGSSSSSNSSSRYGYERNADGSLKLDADGKPKPTYEQWLKDEGRE